MPTSEVPLTLYHELDPTLFSATSDTFIGQVYGLLGLRNIADEAEGDTGGYPQLNAEFIISADPDLIFLADTKCCGESAETVAARARLGDRSRPSPTATCSRWTTTSRHARGPRVVDYMQAVADAVERVIARLVTTPRSAP